MNTSPLDADIAAYLAHGRARGWSDATLRNYSRKLTQLATFCRRRGCERSADVTVDDLDALLQAELDQGTARSSRVQLAILIRHLFQWFQDRGRIAVNPARNIPIPDDGEFDLPAAPLSEAEVHALFAGLPRRNVLDLRNICLLELLYGCGMRRGEVVRLDTDDVDMAQRVVVIRASKGGQSRVVPLMGTAATAARDYLALRRELLRGPDHGAFFLSATGKRFDDGCVAMLFRHLNRDRGPDARPLHAHQFRHAIAVHLVRGGVDIRRVQEFLGHATLDTTKIYLRLVPGHLKADYDRAMPEIAVGI